ncbi:LarC family nickel insertion protein [Brevibacillus humidisoli]|uniref:LarC family nickel insertion protein n=1 Tax=Brevibacillus humidisoli TaxID=2895522 RepID=UPI001E353439|nr:LarC family nickel insertion protein [Brevibacillus humidisoli]UFJ39692.1 LarC family nickel insertion protein [Brevibacillus humidisoli]
MRIAYLDCFSGISGDMTLAALVDAGADREEIERQLRKLPLGSFRMEWRNVVKKGVSALKVDVIDEELYHYHAQEHQHHDHSATHEHHGHDHEHHHDHVHQHHQHHHDHTHEHDHGHHHDHTHEHDHGHHHDHTHEHDHGHQHGHHHHHHHAHRAYREIVELIQAAGYSPRVTERALAIFQVIGASEAKIHNVPIDTVHFHEVGALDSIVDIVGVALALENLNIDTVYSGPIPTGSGYVRCDHGLYPVPAPATLEMLKNIPLRFTTIEKELTTPTGAGIAAALVKQFGPLPAMTVESIGYGAGTRDLPDQPNVLRVLIGQPNQ